LLPLLAACAAEAPSAPPPSPWRDTPQAVSRVHRTSVPHTDRLGQARATLDPARSLLPLVLDNAMVDYQRGTRFGFATAAAAGFNAVAPWSEQPREAVLEAAAGSRLLAVMPPAKPGETDSIEADDIAWFDPAQVELVRAMPFRASQPVADLVGMEGLGALTRAVADQSAGRSAKALPVWAVLQAFGAPAEDRRLPSPAEARALAYGALVQGASGLVWFAEDSYAGRSIGAIGIAPTPPLDYGIQVFDTGNRPLRPKPSEVAAAGGLWQAVARLNREIERLSPALLSPTAAFDYRVRVRALEPADSLEPAPLRLLLKSFDNRFTLIAVNLTNKPWRLSVTLPQPMGKVERWFDTDTAPALQRGGTEFEEDFAAHAVRLYRLSP